MALDKDGVVHVAGWGQHGQLGLGGTVVTCFEFEPVRALGAANIQAIGAGSLFSAAVDSEGRVYTWGNGEQGQLGMSIGMDRPKEHNTPTRVKKLGKEFAVEICCGETSMTVLCKSGKVFGWGRGFYETDKNGAKKKESHRDSPQLITRLDPCQYWIIKCPKELSFIVSPTRECNPA